MSESTDPLTRAIELSIEFESAEGDRDVDSFLAEHEDLRDILEPLLRQDDTPDQRVILGDFELVRELGRGGMGVVYEAIQTLLGRTVALKLLPPHRSLSPRSLAMFRREATLAASLDHPGIARVLEFQEIDGQLALAMELIDGMPLDDVIESVATATTGSPTSVDLARAAGVAVEGNRAPDGWRGSYEMTVVELVRQTAEALEHAHSRGIVHRDVKPGNILITPHGKSVLTDFGLAREEGMLGVTRTGEFSGTYQYAAPEQLEGRLDELDGRTDVYALGATLYEMLTLKRPLEAQSLTELVMRIRREEPQPPSRLNPRVTPDLEAVLLCALEKDRRSRYATSGEFAIDLANVIAGRPVKARRLSSTVRSVRWVKRNPQVSTFVSILLVAVVGISWLLADTARAKEETSSHLQRYENIWVGTALDNLIERADEAHPPWPEQAAELRELVDIAEGFLSKRASQREAIAQLRRGYTLAEPAKRGTHRHSHAASARIDDLLGMIRRLGMESRADDVSVAARTAAEAEIALIRAKRAELLELVDESNRVQIDDPLTAALHDRLETQLYGLQQLENHLLPDLRYRLDWAQKIEQRSIGEQETPWSAAAQRVAKDERFKGFELRPHIGFVPLGKDPTSGLEEFAHLLSGARPTRGDDGELKLTVEHGMVFVLMPGGLLSTKVTTGVQLDPFFVGKHEMSRAQWERLARGVKGLRWRDGGIADVRNTGEMDKPVNGVSWFMCDDLLSNSGLQIPTTAHWEYCISFERGLLQAEQSAFCNLRDRSYADAVEAKGDPRPRGVRNFDDGYPFLAPIVSMQPTPGGLYHLMGNVSEWCRDVHSRQVTPPRDGDGLRERTAAPNAPRILNGGHFLDTMPARIFDRRSPHSANRSTGIRAMRQVILEEPK